MRELVRCAAAEFLKLKRSAALPIAFVAPLGLVLILSLALASDEGRLIVHSHKAALSAIEDGLPFWTAFLSPLTMTLQAALAASMEHGAEMWPHLFTLPVHRRNIYIGKALTVSVLGAVSAVTLWLASISAAYLLDRRYIPQESQWQWGGTVAVTAGLGYCATWSLTAIQLILALSVRTFAIPVLLGILGVLSGAIVTTRLGGVANWLVLVPWCLPMTVSRRQGNELYTVAVQMCCAVVVLAVGVWWLSRRECQ